MALTKQDLEQEAYANIDDYPALAAAFRAGDPTVIQHIGAIAAMGAAMLQQMEVAAMERFTKERDSTILADAAIRGIVPRAKGVKVEVLAKNPSTAPLSLQMGRVILDAQGNSYRVETPVTIAAGQTTPVISRQGITQTIRHKVSENTPFYAIPIPEAEDGSYLASITVSSNAGDYEWRSHYTNVQVGELVYHVEVDDKRRVYVRFGMRDVVGHQPAVGEVITVTVGYAFGDIVPEAGSTFGLEYVNGNEALLELEFSRVVQRGEDPMPMEVLRELAKYPSTYADDAVFMGEFDFLVRKNFQGLRFSSVWNEAQEELVRGVNIENMNCLFVAVVGADGQEVYIQPGQEGPQEPVEGEPQAAQPVPPVGYRRLREDELTSLQHEIRRKIWAADNSYRVFFCTPVQEEIGMRVSGKASSSFNRADVVAQIRKLLLDHYGENSAAARRGFNRPLYREVYELLRKSVPALVGGDADWQLEITNPYGNARPELWRFVSEASLTVEIDVVNTVRPSWGA